MARDGGALRPGNCGDCGAGLDSARQTYCPDHAWERRQRSNLEADRRRRQADRDRRTQPVSATADGGVLLPPEAVRLLALQLKALRMVVDEWRQTSEHLAGLEHLAALEDLAAREALEEEEYLPPPEGLEQWDADVELAESHQRDADHLAGLAADHFVAAMDNLLPPETLGR